MVLAQIILAMLAGAAAAAAAQFVLLLVGIGTVQVIGLFAQHSH